MDHNRRDDGVERGDLISENERAHAKDDTVGVDSLFAFYLHYF